MYKYLYKYYLWLFYKWRPYDIPEWNSVFAIGFLIMPNIVLILFFLGKIIDQKVMTLVGYVIVPYYLLFVITNYFLFIRNKHYEMLLKEVMLTGERERKKGLIIVILLAVEALSIPWLLLATNGFGYYK